MDEKLKERFFNIYKFSNQNNNKFILLLRSGISLYEYLDDLEKFSEMSLPKKEGFDSHLNMEGITDADYVQGKKVYEDFKIKNLGEYHNLYL